MDKLLDDVMNAKLGSPLKGRYTASPVVMYKSMRPAMTMAINDVLAKAENGASQKDKLRLLEKRKQ